ncbi:MAG: hypothetical protein WBE26_05760 [Phycisphaerae bacterium]
MKIPVFTEYKGFYAYMKGWAFRRIKSLIVLGTPGVGKTWTAQQLLRDRPHHWFSARQTPLEIYKRICDAPHIPVVFDDVAALLRDKTFLDLLKNLCERGTSTLRWGTSTPLLEGRPTSFRTTAKVLILLNSLPKKNEGDLAAVLDRCHHFSFQPDKSQAIAYMREYFPEDRKLIDLMETLAVMPTLRMLGKIRDLDDSIEDGDSLYEQVAKVFGVPDAVVTLIDIMERFPEEEWCKRYMEATSQGDRQFRRNRKIAAELLACRKTQNECPNVRLVVPEPPAPPLSAPLEAKNPDSGYSDIEKPARGHLDMPNRLRWWNPENN